MCLAASICVLPGFFAFRLITERCESYVWPGFYHCERDGSDHALILLYVLVGVLKFMMKRQPSRMGVLYGFVDSISFDFKA